MFSKNIVKLALVAGAVLGISGCKERSGGALMDTAVAAGAVPKMSRAQWYDALKMYEQNAKAAVIGHLESLVSNYPEGDKETSPTFAFDVGKAVGLGLAAVNMVFDTANVASPKGLELANQASELKESVEAIAGMCGDLTHKKPACKGQADLVNSNFDKLLALIAQQTAQ